MDQSGNKQLIERIRMNMEKCGGTVTFAEFMSQCLYDEEYGYYTKEGRKVGKEGDFYTSAYVGGAMGWTVAAYIAETVQSDLEPDEPFALLEWGGGEGRLAKMVLDTLEHEHPGIYRRLRFVSAEASPYHRRSQEETLAGHHGRVLTIVPPDDPVVQETLKLGYTILYANELLDAFPVHRLRRTGGEVREIYVGWNEASASFKEVPGPISDPRIAELLGQLSGSLKEGQTAEINLAAYDWILQLGSSMARGAAAIIDYGDISSELYSPHRMNGTLMCYRKHTAHSNPYLWIGEQDITAHVDFELCRLSALQAGFTSMTLRTQKQFLVDFGILNKLQQNASLDPFSPEARNNRAIRQLLISDGMSELFKVLTMHKEP